MAPWRATGGRVELTFIPFHLKRSATDLKIFSASTHQCFGHWSGRVLDDSGEWVRVADVTGWAEDVHNRWGRGAQRVVGRGSRPAARYIASMTRIPATASSGPVITGVPLHTASTKTANCAA